MSHFCLLGDPKKYLAQDQNLVSDKTGRKYWLDLYVEHFEQTLTHAREHYGPAAARRIQAARQEFAATIDKLRSKPKSLPTKKLNGIELCRMREKCLRGHNLSSPFAHVKERANASARALYRQVVRKLHAMEGPEMWLRLIESVFAGNIFDLGTPMTANAAAQVPDFLDSVENTKPRPWLIDDFDLLLKDLLSGPPMKWTKAVVFLDNAGSDFILGIMPLARELALEGVGIVLAANELASLNDITADEAIAVVEELAAGDEDLAALIRANMLEVVSTGSGIPLIDLSDVSDELNEVAADADLIIIEGMGRAVESNLDAAFTVDTLRLAVLKDPHVAAGLGGVPMDPICKYTPVAR
ncbi:MAG: DUF89 family protein [Phycisphaerae bacterium]|nr:DUF89 family protein [Phycisphaerae bacterium]